jgi:hypothetical protein
LARQNVASSAARLLPAPQEGDSTSDGGDCWLWSDEVLSVRSFGRLLLLC